MDVLKTLITAHLGSTLQVMRAAERDMCLQPMLSIVERLTVQRDASLLALSRGMQSYASALRDIDCDHARAERFSANEIAEYAYRCIRDIDCVPVLAALCLNAIGELV